MRRSSLFALLAGCAVLGLLACVTINVYFPEAQVKDLSQRIEDAVAEEAASDDGAMPDAEATEEGDVSTIGWLLHHLSTMPLVSTSVQAQAQDKVADPEISNPAIRKIIDSRAQRLREINELKAQGVLGENNEALLDIRSLDQLPLPRRAEVQRLVKAENKDREQMFKEIAAATGADPSTLPQIRTTYAETLRENARSGDWIQKPDGSWQRKP